MDRIEWNCCDVLGCNLCLVLCFCRRQRRWPRPHAASFERLDFVAVDVSCARQSAVIVDDVDSVQPWCRSKRLFILAPRLLLALDPSSPWEDMLVV